MCTTVPPKFGRSWDPLRRPRKLSDLNHQAQATAAQALRESYGKLLARLACDWKDLTSAEDALAEAFEKALTHWPRHGVPRSPQAWLLTVARRQMLQRWRRQSRAPSEPAPSLLEQIDGDYPDDRLRLMLICAHPALDPGVRTPLMLQVVLGLQAREIASALLVSPDSLAQRLVRAKRKLKEARVGWEEPGQEALAERIQAVLDAIYAAYALSWETFPASPTQVQDLDGEALYLARLVVQLQPENPEARGLLALMLHCEARKPARQGPDGRFIPLSEQEVGRWDAPLIDQAENHLRRAAALNRPGPYQLEAAVQSAHNQRVRGLHTPWRAIAALYQQLNESWPSWGSMVGETIACIENSQFERARELLEAIPSAVAQNFQPWWVARAYLAEKTADQTRAFECYERAIGLCAQPAMRDYLKSRQTASLPQ